MIITCCWQHIYYSISGKQLVGFCSVVKDEPTVFVRYLLSMFLWHKPVALSNYVFAESLKPVWQAIVLLERATRKSPSNFHIKLLLIALYAKLGACAPCCMFFESMEIKHIQHDALGYVV